MAAIFILAEWLFWWLFLKIFLKLREIAPAQLPIGVQDLVNADERRGMSSSPAGSGIGKCNDYLRLKVARSYQERWG